MLIFYDLMWDKFIFKLMYFIKMIGVKYKNKGEFNKFFYILLM